MKVHYTKVQIRTIIGAGLLMMGFGILNAGASYFIAPVTEDLGFQRASFSLYYTIMNLTSILMIPLAGRLLKRYPPHKILAVSLCWGSACIAAFSLAGKLWHFYLLGALLGLLKDSCTMLMVGVVINRAFGTQSGAPLGIAMSGSGLCGLFLGIIMPNVLLQYGWRFGYRFQACAWAAIFFFAMLLLRSPHFTDDDSAHAPSSEAAAAECSTGMTYREATGSAWFYVLLFALIMTSAPGNFLLHMPAYYVEQGLTEQFAGKIISCYSFGIMLFKMVEGRLFDRLGDIQTTVLAMGMFAVGLWISLSDTPVVLCIGAAFLSFGMASVTVLPPLLTRNIFGQKDYAPIYSLVSMDFTIANALGSPMWGLIHDISGSYRWGIQFIPLFILAGTGIIVWILYRKKWENKAIAKTHNGMIS